MAADEVDVGLDGEPGVRTEPEAEAPAAHRRVARAVADRGAFEVQVQAPLGGGWRPPGGGAPYSYGGGASGRVTTTAGGGW